MKHLIVILFIVFFSVFRTGLHAQNEAKIDSLTQLVEQENIHDTIRLVILEELADLYVRVDFDKCFEYSNQLLELSQELDNQEKQVEAYILLSLASIEKNEDLNSIKAFLDKGLAICQQSNDSTLTTKIYSTTARVYMRDGFHDEAYSLYQKGLLLSEQLGDTVRMIVMMNNMSLILKKEEKYERAKEYYKLGIGYAEKIQNNKRYLAALTNNLGAIYDKQDSMDIAKSYYEKSLAIKKELNARYSMVPTLHNIAVINKMRKNYELAEMQFSEGYDIAKELEYVDGMGLILVGWADCALNQRQFQKALFRLNEAKSILGENGDLYTQMHCYEYLSYTYDSIGNYEAAFRNYKIYNKLQDSIFHQESANRVSELETQYQVSQKESENKLLRAEQEAAIRQSRNSKLLAIGSFIALLLALGWGYSIYQSKLQKEKMNEELEQKVKERTHDLNAANTELQQANHELRTFNYIASHDIKEPIRVINSFVGLIYRQVPSEIKKSLDFHFSTVKRSTQQMYTLLEDFSKYTSLSKEEVVNKDEVDLNIIVQSLRDNFSQLLEKKNGEIISQELPIIMTGPSMIYIALKHLVENGLEYNNSLKPTVEISFCSTDDKHRIIVSDNGVGIDSQYHQQVFDMFKRLHNRETHQGSGIGLAIVKLMVKKLNGDVRVESELGLGSKFIIELAK